MSLGNVTQVEHIHEDCSDLKIGSGIEKLKQSVV